MTLLSRRPRWIAATTAALLLAAWLSLPTSPAPQVHAMKTETPPPPLEAAQASAFARLVLKSIQREYPNKPDHVLNDAADAHSAASRCIRPSTAASTGIRRSTATGCWSGCCAAFPTCRNARRCAPSLDEHLTAENIKTEAAYFAPAEPAVVRAHLRLGLAAEAGRGAARLGRRRRPRSGREPPAAGRGDRAPLRRLPAQADLSDPQRRPSEHGLRAGFRPGLRRAPSRTSRLRELLEERSRAYFAEDAGYPAAWEPGGEDFFSPSLMEADLMRRVLPAAEFRSLARPVSAGHRPAASRRRLLTPATVSRPQRPAARPPGRPEPEPGLVHAQHRRGAARRRSGPQGAGRVAARHAAAAACSTWPAATMPANTGWRRSRSTCSPHRHRNEEIRSLSFRLRLSVKCSDTLR